MKLLHNKSETELINLFLSIAYGNNEKPNITSNYIINASPDCDYFMGCGALMLLTEMKGKDFALGLMGKRKPITLKEKIKKFFFDSYPSKKSSSIDNKVE